LGNPQSLNRYPYVGGNPVNFNDPLGLEQVCTLMSGTGDETFDCINIGWGCVDGQCASDPFGGGSGGFGGGIGGILGAIGNVLNGGGLAGNTVPGNCFLPGACPSLPIPSILDFLPKIPGPGCDFGPCGNDPTNGFGNGLLGPGIGNMGLDPVAMLAPWFGKQTKTRQCFGTGSPQFGVCEMPCESGGSVGGVAIKFTELQKACGPISKCPNIITTDTSFLYIFGVGFSLGDPNVTHCSPNGSVPGGILPENH
jgi:hypothetical protein